MNNILIFTTLQFALALLIGTTAQDYCPYRWEPYEDSCLDLSELIGTEDEAEQHCQDINGSLAIVEEQYQDYYLIERLLLDNMTSVPLGCTIDEDEFTWTCEAKEEDQWFWYNATYNAGFWNWEPGQPDNNQDTSGRIFLNVESNWTDEYRDNQERYMMVACLTPTIDDEVKCPLSWQPLDNKCVYFASDFTGRPRAVRTICEDLGGSMLTIDSQEQNDFITQQLVDSPNNGIALGCNDQGDEGFWRCDDRVYPYMVHWTEETQTGFWSWGVDEPADADPEADCAILRQNGLWKALPCQDQYTQLLTCEQSPTNIVCPAGFEPYGDACLQLSTFTGSATEAKNQCLSIGGRLIVIENEGQNVFLQYELEAPINALAIACSDEAEEGTWICDGKDPTEWYWKSSSDFQGYWNWKPDEPISGRENNCMYLYRKAGNHRSEPCDQSMDMRLACIVDPSEELPTTKQPNTKQPSTSTRATIASSKSTALRTAITYTTNPAPKETTHSTQDPGNKEPQNGLSSGAIVGIVFGVMVLVVIVVGLGFFLRSRNQKSASLVKDHDLSEY